LVVLGVAVMAYHTTHQKKVVAVTKYHAHSVDVVEVFAVQKISIANRMILTIQTPIVDVRLL
jgi:hypothetical protein